MLARMVLPAEGSTALVLSAAESRRQQQRLIPTLSRFELPFFAFFIRFYSGKPGFFFISAPEAPERGQLAPYGPRRRKAKTAATTTKAAF